MLEAAENPEAAARRESMSDTGGPRRSLRSSNLHSGLLTFEDFARLCQEIGFMGNTFVLFRFLDADMQGAITVEEIDTKVAATLWRGGIEVDLQQRPDWNKMNRSGSAMDGAHTTNALRYALARQEHRKKI